MMSDFLLSFEKEVSGAALLGLLRKIYGDHAPSGTCHEFPWGRIAILSDMANRGHNVYWDGSVLMACLGDLSVERRPDSLKEVYRVLRQAGMVREPDARSGGSVFEKLNGAFVVVFADADGVHIITDPLSFTPVYQACDGDSIASLGSHSDLVSCVSRRPFEMDAVSLTEFVNLGTPTFPHTAYQNVFQLHSASIYGFRKSGDANQAAAVCRWKYWRPPDEAFRESVDLREMIHELRDAFVEATQTRTKHGKSGVLLSGGMDSRFIMASIPPESECVGITFGNGINREMKIARRVAHVFRREWIPLFRDTDYLGRQMLNSIRFIGCESDWVHAHAAGFADEISACDIDVLLNGSWVGCFLRAPLAEEYARCDRLIGLLPCRHIRREIDDFDRISDFATRHLASGNIDAAKKRRTLFVASSPGVRSSRKEWLEVNPITQRPEISCWAVERRLFPSRLIAADRRILDFAFRCPPAAKLEDRVFVKAALPVIKNAAGIPDANSGVRPGSGLGSHLAQRAIRKLDNLAKWHLGRIFGKSKIQHSWHDYQAYWRQSPMLDKLRQDYGSRLDSLDGTLFQDSGRSLLNDKNIRWEYGFRLLHLGIWIDHLKAYQDKRGEF